eukprot:GILI01026182.1.p1 GENE.GILI01026182.1~~GILI01026182.1.p1  ORF type:complete len:124 (+),score=18.59 GILI01026182.1:36-374(+)
MTTISSSNLLGVLQQLKDAQDRAKRAEAKVLQLEIENERLQQDVRRAQLERVSSSVRAFASNDDLIIELQNQLAAAVNRNTQLELQMYEVNASRTASIASAVHPSPSRKELL